MVREWPLLVVQRHFTSASVSPFSAGSHPLQLAPPHHTLDLERPICTFLFPLHCAAQCADVTGRVQRMSPVTDDQHLRSRAWNCLSRKLHFPATASALSRNWTTWRRRKKKKLMMMIAFKETLFLSRFVTIKEVVTVFKKHVFYPSKRATQT